MYTAMFCLKRTNRTLVKVALRAQVEKQLGANGHGKKWGAKARQGLKAEGATAQRGQGK